MSRKTYSVYTDGSSSGGSGAPTGWGWLVTDGEIILAAGCAGSPDGTNNVAELRAAIQGLNAALGLGLPKESDIELVSDSQYVLGLAAGNYEAHKNTDLVTELQRLVAATGARCRWVRGHSGDVLNEQVDRLAKHGRSLYTPDDDLYKRKKERREERQKRREIVKSLKEGQK
jgi:ribonuclease HI